jgi:hypothetical protein
LQSKANAAELAERLKVSNEESVDEEVLPDQVYLLTHVVCSVFIALQFRFSVRETPSSRIGSSVPAGTLKSADEQETVHPIITRSRRNCQLSD